MLHENLYDLKMEFILTCIFTLTFLKTKVMLQIARRNNHIDNLNSIDDGVIQKSFIKQI